ncbi:MAG: hypothetical protein HQ542_09910 [Bacteroidia bacterium]|nr:hypothetical protein [Bacteroidia bacterium]
MLSNHLSLPLYPLPPTRTSGTGWLASLNQSLNLHGCRFVAPPAPLTHPHLRAPPAATPFVFWTTLIVTILSMTLGKKQPSGIPGTESRLL